jgi:23S rRNA (cytosine1962-C5)-methyltransferase
MTRSADQVREALQTYYAMNRRAIAAVKTGGWLLTCSCTGRVSEAEFLDMLSAAASAEKRQLQIVRVNGAGGDHPVLADVPESRYLKAVFARVLG